MPSFRLAAFLRWRKHGQQQRDQRGRRDQQRQHAEHAEVGISLVERDVDEGERRKADHVGNDRQGRRDDGVTDRLACGVVRIAALAVLEHEAAGDLHRVTDADGQQQHRGQHHHGGQLELGEAHQAERHRDRHADADQREQCAAPVAELQPQHRDDNRDRDREQPPLVDQVGEHPGEEVGLAGDQQLDAVVLGMLVHHRAHFAHPRQVDLLDLVGVVGDHVRGLGDTEVLVVVLVGAAVAVGVPHRHQHWCHDRVGLDAFTQEGELRPGFLGIVADALGRDQALEHQAVLVGAHVLDLLRGDVDEVRLARMRQRLELVVDLLDLVDEPGLPDIALLDLQGEHHQVAHAEVVFGIQVRRDVAVGFRQQRVRVVADIQLVDLQRRDDGRDDQGDDDQPAVAQDDIGVGVGPGVLFGLHAFLPINAKSLAAKKAAPAGRSPLVVSVDQVAIIR